MYVNTKLSKNAILTFAMLTVLISISYMQSANATLDLDLNSLLSQSKGMDLQGLQNPALGGILGNDNSTGSAEQQNQTTNTSVPQNSTIPIIQDSNIVDGVDKSSIPLAQGSNTDDGVNSQSGQDGVDGTDSSGQAGQASQSSEAGSDGQASQDGLAGLAGQSVQAN